MAAYKIKFIKHSHNGLEDIKAATITISHNGLENNNQPPWHVIENVF